MTPKHPVSTASLVCPKRVVSSTVSPLDAFDPDSDGFDSCWRFSHDPWASPVVLASEETVQCVSRMSTVSRPPYGFRVDLVPVHVLLHDTLMGHVYPQVDSLLSQLRDLNALQEDLSTLQSSIGTLKKGDRCAMYMVRENPDEE